MHALIRFWTGTGNTARAVGLVAEVLVTRGWTVDSALVRFDSPLPSAEVLARADVVLVACPTLGFSAPDHFLRWLSHWPQNPGKRPIAGAVLAVGGATLTRRGVAPGDPGVVVGQIRRILGRRGVVVSSWHAAFYPENWTQVIKPPSPEESQPVFTQADGTLRTWAEQWGDRPPVRRPSFPWALPIAVLFRGLGRRFLGKLFAADLSCTGCGLCVRSCPAGVLHLVRGRPAWNADCDVCNKCINLCPSQSIQSTWARLIFHGGGQLLLTIAALALVANGSWGWGIGLWGLGSLLQLTFADFLWTRIERRSRGRTLTLGWTQGWRRYLAPGYKGR